MKLLELEVNNIRGITHLLLTPKGLNCVIWGPNGSGKSAVVDAIDFLMTGRVSRLAGKGTSGITLSKHGPHIDHKPEEAMVRAIIQLPEIAKPVEIKRCMADPDNLEFDVSKISYLEPIMILARRGQHVLTRREILKYITAEAGTRAEEIQELLNISDIEDIRKKLVKVENGFKKDVKTAKHAVETAREAVKATIQEKTFSEDIVLKFVNRNRAILGGQAILTLCSTELKIGIKPLTVFSSGKPINVTLFEEDIKKLRNVISEQNQAEIAKNDSQLRDLIATVRSNPRMLRALSRFQLTNLGIKLIDETGNCPLCDTLWPPGELCEHLKQKISRARVVKQQKDSITQMSATIEECVNSTIANLQKVTNAAKIVDLNDEVLMLQSWLRDLRELSSALSATIEKYPDPHFGSDKVQRMLAPAEVVQILTRIHTAVKAKYPESTPEQKAWDILTRLEENLKALESVQVQLKNAELSLRRAKILHDSFISARDVILGNLYDAIRDRFVDLYRKLHELDESTFSAKIEPAKAGLDLKVDFYGRGTHPPHALHSEGHQDSMGFCLYLALSERLAEGLIDLVILDDVVMSVDSDHRRQVCRLLATFFPDRQFFITTHDRTWAKQLRNEGVVDPEGMVEFCNWHIETGPQVNYEADIWKRIEEDLKKNDVPSAAARLRRGSEQFFGMVCDALGAQVTYKLNGLWELGDFLLAAMHQYKKLLGQAKNAAKSWGNETYLDMFQELDSTRGSIFTRSNVEQWAVNTNVHHNNWANFSENDFRPVVEAFQDLYGLYLCSKCSGMLHLATMGKKPVAVRCNCGQVNWNLRKKVKGIQD
ncbi:MAG: AAA family ATPase [Candidatus Eremiobacteraeota bacterium]|nr:AAA family ATPase [Candidatus Eremiobacteraeota bacterium]